MNWIRSHRSNLFASLLAMAIGLPSLMYPLSVDQGVFAYIGRIIVDGGLPFRDAWDVKPPGIYALYAIGQLLFHDPVTSPRILELLFVGATGWLLVTLCSRIDRKPAGVLAAFLFAIAYWHEFNFSTTAQSEGFSAPFVVGAIVACLPSSSGRTSPYLAGILIGVALLLKSTFVLFAIPPLILLIANRPVAQNLAKFLAGAATMPLLVVALYSFLGSLAELRELVEAQIAYSRSSAGFDAKRFRAIVFGLFEFYPLTYILGGMALPMLAAFRAVRSYRFLWAWYLVFWVQIIWQNKYMDYQFSPLLLPSSVVVAIVLTGIYHSVANRLAVPQQRMVAYAAVGLLGLVLIRNLSFYIVPVKVLTGQAPRQWFDRLFVFNYYGYSDSKGAASRVRALSSPTDRVLVYGFDPTIYIMSDRMAPTRHFSNAPIRLEGWFPDPMRRRFFAELEGDVKRSPPKVLVTDYQLYWGIRELSKDLQGPIEFCGLRYEFDSQFRHLYVYRLGQ